MSQRSDMMKLIRAAKKQGCLVDRLGSGHWRITTPSESVVIAAFSPRTAGGVRDTKARLKRAGVSV